LIKFVDLYKIYIAYIKIREEGASLLIRGQLIPVKQGLQTAVGRRPHRISPGNIQACSLKIIDNFPILTTV